MKKYKVKGVEIEDNDVSPYGSGVRLRSRSPVQRLDIEDEFTKMLSEQLAKEIDREILRNLGLEPDRNKRRKNSIQKIFNV